MAEIGIMKKLTIGGSTYTIPEYNLPIASTSVLGGVKIGTGLSINSTTGVLSATGLDYDEADPIFVASPAHGITSSDITNWNSKTSNTGTVTKVTAGTGLSIGSTSGGNFTTSGTINHTNSVTAQTTQAVYPIKIDAQGHISGYGTAVTSMPASDVSSWAKASTKPSYTFSEIGSKPTTLSGYGITDAYTKTQVDGLVAGVLHYKGTKASVANLPTTGNTTGDVWHITADGSEYAWDGSIWQELGTAIDLSGYAQLSGASFTGPVTFGDSVTADELNTGDLVVTGAASFANNIQANTINGVAVGSSPKFTDTTYSSLTAASGGTAVSLVTTGEKYTWNNKQDKLTNPVTGTGTNGYLAKWNGTGSITNGPQLGSTTTTYLNNAGSWATPPGTATGHTHGLSIATSTGTSSISLAANTKYQLSAGNNTYIFTTPTVPTKTSDLTNDGNGTSAFATMDDIGSFGGGTVTSITLKAGSGIALDTDNTAITTTGTRTISHSDTSSQASVSNSGRTYIQSITLDGFGHVTALSSATETVTNTDTKLQVAAVTSGTTYYPIVGTGTTAATRQYDTTGFIYKGTNGTTSAVGSAQLTLGNSTASGTANNKQGQLIMYGSNAKKATITLAAPSADISLALPTSGGTLALTSQIPIVPTSTGNATTGITATTTATKTSLGTASSIYGVKSGTNSTTTASKASGSNGSASNWVFEDVACDDITAWSAGSGSASFTATVSSHVLSFSLSHTHTAPSLTYSGKTASHVKSGGNGTAPSWSFTDVTVPIRADSATSVPNVSVASATVSITDPGHTHTI